MPSHCRLAVHWNFGRLQRTADRKFDAWLMSPVGDCHRSSNFRDVPATAPAPPDHPRWLAPGQLGAPPPTRRMPVFEVLEQHGLEVYLVNARHTKNVPGRKSDVQECQWLLKLHAFGLLNNSFQPTDEIRVARALWRQRGNLVADASSTILRMQKVLIEMNIQLSNVLSDISGVSGMRMIGAILEGERDPQ